MLSCFRLFKTFKPFSFLQIGTSGVVVLTINLVASDGTVYTSPLLLVGSDGTEYTMVPQYTAADGTIYEAA